jgi:hypothetical protein
MTELENRGAVDVMPASPETVLANASEVATLLAELILTRNLYIVVGRDRNTGEERRHVEVGGWQALGAMFGAIGGTPLHAETVWSRRIWGNDNDLIVYESRAEIRTLAGEVAGSAESMCSSAERNWRTADEYAVRGMAETRAESRAWRRAAGWVVKLAGFGDTPAEEIPVPETPADEPEPTMLPRWAAPASDGVVRQVAATLVDLFKAAGIAEPAKHASAVGTSVMANAEDTFPVCVARVIWDIAYHITAPDEVASAAASRASAAPDATADAGTQDPSNDTETTTEGTTA